MKPLFYCLTIVVLISACSAEKSNENESAGNKLSDEKLNSDSIVVVNKNSNAPPAFYLMNWVTIMDVPNKWVSYSAGKKDTIALPRFKIGDFEVPNGVTTIEYENGSKSYIDIFKAVVYKSKIEFEITGYELDNDIRIYAKVNDSIMNTVAFDIESEKHGNYHWLMTPTGAGNTPNSTFKKN